MAWTVIIPRPPSVNSLYRVVLRTARDGRRFHGIAKTEEGTRFHEDSLWLLRAAPRNGWKPPAEGYIRIKVRPFLVRPIDSDNLLKALSDVIQAAIGVDDSRFVWCTFPPKLGVRKADARIELEILDDAGHD